ncbi:MAG: hypothetical protein ACP5K1_05915, partial [Candidatus Bathyarchaeia archaeon]
NRMSEPKPYIDFSAGGLSVERAEKSFSNSKNKSLDEVGDAYTFMVSTPSFSAASVCLRSGVKGGRPRFFAGAIYKASYIVIFWLKAVDVASSKYISSSSILITLR